MIGATKPYSDMKESGVPWLGKVPAHWVTRRLRNLVELRVSSVDKHASDGEEPVRLCNYVDVYKRDRIRASQPFMRATASPSEIQRFRLRPGDVLITKDSESWNDIAVPALVEDAADDLVSGYHLAMLRPRNSVEGTYLFRALQAPGLAYQFHVEATGVTRYGLSHSAIRSVCVPLPPLEEQRAIARFLDYMDRRIRRYIAAKQKLIKLLEEEKQAIIHQAVTGQIDVRTGRPYPAYKPSGVEWLGDVPEGWEVRRLKSVATIRYGLGQPPPLWDGGLPLIRATNVKRGVISEHNMIRVDPRNLSSSKNVLLQSGDIIVVRSGAYTADSARIPVQWAGSIAGYDMVVSPSKMLSEFVALSLLAPYLRDDQLIVSSMRSAQAHLNAEELGSALILHPPRCEQESIVEFCEARSSELVRARQTTVTQIALLREYRTRLIADVVTGKLDVREAAAALPDEPAEDDDTLEPLDELEGVEAVEEEPEGDSEDDA